MGTKDPVKIKVSDLVKYTYCALLWDIEEKQKKDTEKQPKKEKPDDIKPKI